MFMLTTAASVAAIIEGECSDEMQAIINIFDFIITIIQWVVPILLILFGTIDLVKAVTAGKEEDIKKNQKALFKRAISAVIVFLVPLAVKIIMGLIGSSSWKACWDGAEPKIDLNGLSMSNVIVL